VLSFGSIHTTAPESVAERARAGVAPVWPDARVLTGLSPAALRAAGVRPGTRVIVARARRTPWALAGGDLVASYFLDDRADLVAWLRALEALKDDGAGAAEGVVFAATTSEEVGGEGAAYLLQGMRPPVVVALEIGPSSPDAPFPVDADPTVWVADGYAPPTRATSTCSTRRPATSACRRTGRRSPAAGPTPRAPRAAACARGR
jgi:putative aminopeptidase FrvX